MANEDLRSAYKQLLASEGIPLDEFDPEFLYKLFKFEDEMNRRRAPDRQPLDDTVLQQRAIDVATSGGVWNHRIQALVPSVALAADARINHLNEAYGSAFEVPAEEFLLFGEFPTLQFNAAVEPTEFGYLVLINSGLAQLLMEVGMLLSEARPFDLPADILERRVDYASEMAIGMVRKYREKKNFLLVRASGGRQDETSYDLRFNSFVLEVTLVFAIAHEIAHIVLGHCGGGRKHHLIGSAEFLHADIPLGWKEELAADSLAAMIVETWFLNRLSNNDRVEDELVDYFVSHGFFAPLFFFSCERLVNTWPDPQADAAGSSTHPPPTLRQRLLAQQMAGTSHAHRAALLQTRPYRTFLKRVEMKAAEAFLDGTHEGREGMVEGSSDELLRLLETLAEEVSEEGSQRQDN
ncbi:hypothetical protein ASC95_11125 [Pelomonas sp. Root1217]|uniref:hypothetical protein n=1 Tax=Pelomonas sp. Root1217 TaxID=1736430 RepID=UPI00070DB6D2|nr:hypothetical protein [Pelomonas sp. Root1217]KQV53295.1 hypothetical protein ASC95_11125 [Pelomonas sp. Root1217]